MGSCCDAERLQVDRNEAGFALWQLHHDGHAVSWSKGSDKNHQNFVYGNAMAMHHDVS